VKHRGGYTFAAVLAVLALFVSACTTSDDGGDDGDSAAADGDSSGGGLGPGVTDDTIKVGFSYLDLEALAQAGVVKVDQGPVEEITQSLVDDLNDNGGINGRQLEVVYGKYSPAGGTEEALALCARFSEDEEVFAVLGGFNGDTNLCVVEQHETPLIGGVQSPALLERARAPWVTFDASAEHSVEALVRGLDAEGELDGRTIAVFGLASEQGSVDAAKQVLEDAGAEVAFEALNDAPVTDTAAIAALNTTFAQRMQDDGVDAVVVAGQYVPVADFNQAGFHPRLWVSSINALGGFAYTNDFTVFPDVLTTGGPPTDEVLEGDEYKRCERIYEEASGNDVVSSVEEQAQGRASGFGALGIACSALKIFAAGAEAAGDELNANSFEEGIESVGEISLFWSPNSSFGPDKYDAPDELQLYRFNPAWTPDVAEELGLPVGEPISLDG
jgi:hypothetical protein